MEINDTPIVSLAQYKRCLSWVDLQFEKPVKKKTAEGNKLEMVLFLIKKYEDENFPIPLPDII